MRITFTLFSILLLTTAANAQKITGIWRGYFTSSSLAPKEMAEERYKYEVQIEQLSNNSVKGVTYSYKTTVFYGKAAFNGILTMPSKSLILRESKLLDLRISDKSEPCLMTCYLDYTRMGKLEVLEGTFISTDVSGKRDCGSGKIYLEKVTKSDFKKEDFLAKKQPDAAKKPTIKLPAPPVTNRRDNMVVKPIPGRPGTQQSNAAPKSSPPASTTPKTNNKPAQQRPGVKNNSAAVKKDDKSKASQLSRPADKKLQEQQTVMTIPEPEKATPQVLEQHKQNPVPRVLTERENNLVRTINTSARELVVSLYDNGTIDNDTISVYHNNELVISNKKLTYSALTVKIHLSKNESRHELVVVAENLGDIPPNTALMVITTPDGGRERYEIFLASTETRNAKVVINYIGKD